MKASIRKRDGRWLLTRSACGFSSAPTVTEHATWGEARRALLGPAVGSAGPLIERASTPYTQRDWAGGYPRPRGPVPFSLSSPTG